MTWSITVSVTREINCGAVHLFEGCDDLAGGHALGLQAQDFVIRRREAGLALLH